MKKYLGLFVLVSTLLLFSGCGNATKQNNNEDTSTLSDCKKGCDMLTHETIKTQDCYSLCETSKKLESNDINDCDNIETTSNSFITKDICVQNKAIQAKKPEYCESITEATMKDSCYMGVASEMKDQKICEYIKDEIIKGICTTQE